MKVTFTDVTVELGGDPVVEGVTHDVESGTFLGLVGPNGAGKTTLLRTVNAILSPTNGEVFVGDDRIHDLGSRAASRRVATVPQETTLSFAFSVRAVVEMGRNPHRSRLHRSDDNHIVQSALERAAVADLADRPITNVSGGERQRVLVARALAQDAPVFVLDEPTASLDVNHQVRTLELVRGLVDEGRTVLAAIHDLDLAARYCDELALLDDGELRAAGPPDAVLTEERLEAVFDVPVTIDHNPATGSLTVTALPSEDSPDSVATIPDERAETAHED